MTIGFSVEAWFFTVVIEGSGVVTFELRVVTVGSDGVWLAFVLCEAIVVVSESVPVVFMVVSLVVEVALVVSVVISDVTLVEFPSSNSVVFSAIVTGVVCRRFVVDLSAVVRLSVSFSVLPECELVVDVDVT